MICRVYYLDKRLNVLFKCILLLQKKHICYTFYVYSVLYFEKKKHIIEREMQRRKNESKAHHRWGRISSNILFIPQILYLYRIIIIVY